MKPAPLLTAILLAGLALITDARAVTCYLLTQTDQIITLDSANPAAAAAPVAVTGLGTFTLVGIDVRTTVQTLNSANPGVGSLWGMGVDGVSARFYVIDPVSGVATQIGGTFPGFNNGDPDNGWFFGHNPSTDRFRLMNAKDNYEFDPNAPTVIQQTDLAGNPNVNGSAFQTASFGSPSNIYFLDQQPSDTLKTSSDISSGNYSSVGNLGIPFQLGSGLDIYENETYFAGNPVAMAEFYSVNRATGIASFIGAIGGNPAVRALTILPPTFPPPPVQTVSVALTGKKKIRTSKPKVRLRGTATATVGVASVTYRVGNKGRFKTARGTTAWNFVAKRLKPGRSVVTIRATDILGQTSAPAKARIIRRSKR